MIFPLLLWAGSPATSFFFAFNHHIHLDLTGYINSVSPVCLSECKQNPFCDASISTSDGMKKVQIMLNENTSHNSFLGKCSAKSPVKLFNITEGKKRQNQETLWFFNSNTGSRMKDESNITFKYEVKTPTDIKDLQSVSIKSMLDIKGNLKWLEETHTVVCGQQKYKKPLRHGLFADSTSSIKVSVWGELIDEVEEDVTYSFKNITIENYYGLRLNTTAKTTLLK